MLACYTYRYIKQVHVVVHIIIICMYVFTKAHSKYYNKIQLV